jgi:hypothetical protein
MYGVSRLNKKDLYVRGGVWKSKKGVVVREAFGCGLYLEQLKKRKESEPENL